jgi:hypothetical protein
MLETGRIISERRARKLDDIDDVPADDRNALDNPPVELRSDVRFIGLQLLRVTGDHKALVDSPQLELDIHSGPVPRGERDTRSLRLKAGEFRFHFVLANRQGGNLLLR